MKRSGVADLPLHGGSVPQWLVDRMSKLGTAIVESIVIRKKKILPSLDGRTVFD
jgi:hypothetical protein